MATQTLSEYIADIPRRVRLAASLETSADYLWQVATAWNGRRASPELAKRIEQETGGVVPKASLRPDLWEAEAPKPQQRARA